MNLSLRGNFSHFHQNPLVPFFHVCLHLKFPWQWKQNKKTELYKLWKHKNMETEENINILTLNWIHMNNMAYFVKTCTLGNGIKIHLLCFCILFNEPNKMATVTLKFLHLGFTCCFPRQLLKPCTSLVCQTQNYRNIRRLN